MYILPWRSHFFLFFFSCQIRHPLTIVNRDVYKQHFYGSTFVLHCRDHSSLDLRDRRHRWSSIHTPRYNFVIDMSLTTVLWLRRLHFTYIMATSHLKCISDYSLRICIFSHEKRVNRPTTGSQSIRYED